MTDGGERVAEWAYRGVWGVLAKWFRVPRDPPSIPAGSGEDVRKFHPAPGFLRYLKLKFWIGLAVVDAAILVGWLILLVTAPVLGLLLLPFALALAVIPDIVAYIGIHLRYDTTWYVITRRSLRIRRGLWIIRETTITYENIQNIRVYQGPVNRFFGISNVVVDTAGVSATPNQQGASRPNQAIIEGVENAEEIRELILARLRRSKSGGLGDEEEPPSTGPGRWTREHLETLREIRDAVDDLAGGKEEPTHG
jgi:membrane protein YdbS with pleckstrin-like domain